MSLETTVARSQPTTIRSQIFSGLRWTAGSQLLQQVLNLGSSVIVARLLTPTDFGLLAMASVFTGMVAFVLDLGLGAALVQRKDLTHRQISSVFWLNVIMGMVLMLTGFACSGLIASFYKTPALHLIVAAMSTNFLVNSLSCTQIALLQRQMNFRALGLRQLISLAAGILGCVVMALAGFGVWSLVFRILIAGWVEVLMLWSISGWRPQWGFHWSEVKDLIGFGNEVLLTNFLSYIGRNTDNLLIGRFVGSTMLGYYALAYNLMMFPVLRFTQVLSSVMFPALSRLQEDVEQVKRSWFRTVQMIGVVTFPLMIGLIVLAPQFVRVVYGQNWLPAVPLLQVLAISGLLQSLGYMNGTVLLAMGRVRLRLQLTIMAVGLAVSGFVIGLPYGAFGVATCFTIATFFSETIILVKTLEAVGATLGQHFSKLWAIGLASVGMGGSIWLLVQNLPLPNAPLLAVGVLSGSILYFVFLHFFDPSILNEFWSILPAKIKGLVPIRKPVNP